MKLLILCIVLLLGCTDTLPSKTVSTNIDCQISCEYMKHLTGRDGQKGCEETRELILPDGEVITCIETCKALEHDHKIISPQCFLRAQICNQIENVCQ